MTDLPPPATPPPPGWYPDPTTGGDGLRWWDGSSWTDHRSDLPGTTPAAPAEHQGLRPVGEWTSEMMGLVTRRAGHYFTLIVVLIVPTALLSGLASFNALENLVVITDDDGAVTFDNPTATGGDYALMIAMYLLSIVANLVLVLAATRYAWSDVHERTETWMESLRAAFPRLGYGVVGLLVFFGLLFGAYVVAALVVLAAPILGLIAIPAWIAGAAWLWSRLALVSTTAALASGKTGVRTSFQLTAGRTWPLLGRGAILLLFTISLWLVSQVISAPFIAIVGGGQSAEFDPGASEIPFGELAFGANPALHSIGQLFGAIGSGAALVLWAAGFALVYRDLGGPVAADLASEGTVADGGPSGPGHV
ncbi:MAG: DUF2510 domain-containing protein [Actinomycetota bacterium]